MCCFKRAVYWLGGLVQPCLLLLGLFFLVAAAGAEDLDASPSVDSAMSDLLKTLDEETQVATHTKLNVDYVPGIVSVLHGRDLLLRGVRTVYEALELIPGVELSRTQDGQTQVIVRGLGKTFASGKVKYLLNDIPFNMTLQGMALPLMLPIELVERIEMVRGPGSAIYGEFASVGVVNIITREDIGHLFVRRSNAPRRAVGGQLHWQWREAEFTLGVSEDYSHGGSFNSGPDWFQASEQIPDSIPNYSPGPVNDAEQRKYLGLVSHWGRNKLQLHWLQYSLGDFFGSANVLSKARDQLLRTYEDTAIQYNADRMLSPYSQLRYALGYRNTLLDSSQHQLFPPGFAGFNEGVLGAPHYEEEKFDIKAELVYTEIENHTFLVGMEYSLLRQGETYAWRNYVYENGVLVPRENAKYSGDENWLQEGLQRGLLAWYGQDQYQLTPKMNVVAGLRLDYYDDIGGGMTPRLATVYQISRRETLKLQLAQSFRPPTFLEMYSKNNAVLQGNPELESEHLSSVEMSYAYNDRGQRGRASVYLQTLNDLIVVDNTDSTAVTYDNVGGITAHGLELEFQRQFTLKSQWNMAFSYVDAKTDSGHELSDVARFIVNVGLMYEPHSDWDFSVRYRLVSDRPREPRDAREPLDGYHIVNLTLTHSNFLFSGLRLRASIYNLFDSDVRYPAPLANLPGSNETIPAYAEDYPQPGREFGILLEYLFDS